jgi:hypothetical protein
MHFDPQKHWIEGCEGSMFATRVIGERLGFGVAGTKSE